MPSTQDWRVAQFFSVCQRTYPAPDDPGPLHKRLETPDWRGFAGDGVAKIGAKPKP
jgi:hypothetical protein